MIVCLSIPLTSSLRAAVLEFEIQFTLISLNPSGPAPGRRKKMNLNFYFHTSLWYL